MTKTKSIVVFILGGLFVLFVVQNTEVVSVKFLFWQLSMSRILFFPIIFIMGFAAGYIVRKRRTG